MVARDGEARVVAVVARPLPYYTIELEVPEAYAAAEPGHFVMIETRRGLDVIASGETGEGAARFAGGAGRHGRFE